MDLVSHLHTRLGGHEEPERARNLQARTTPEEVHQPADGKFRTIRCRSEVRELHAVNLVADIADAASTAPIVIVDLSLTAHIDAVGLGALVSGAWRCHTAGSELRIVGAKGMVAQALRFTGLSHALSTHAALDEALRRL